MKTQAEHLSNPPSVGASRDDISEEPRHLPFACVIYWFSTYTRTPIVTLLAVFLADEAFLAVILCRRALIALSTGSV